MKRQRPPHWFWLAGSGQVTCHKLGNSKIRPEYAIQCNGKYLHHLLDVALYVFQWLSSMLIQNYLQNKAICLVRHDALAHPHAWISHRPLHFRACVLIPVGEHPLWCCCCVASLLVFSCLYTHLQRGIIVNRRLELSRKYLCSSIPGLYWYRCPILDGNSAWMRLGTAMASGMAISLGWPVCQHVHGSWTKTLANHTGYFDE